MRLEERREREEEEEEKGVIWSFLDILSNSLENDILIALVSSFK